MKDAYFDYTFDTVDIENNVCYINIEYSCFKRDPIHDFYPEILKVDCLVKNEFGDIRKTYFIDSSLSNLMKLEGVCYYGKDDSKFAFLKHPFSVKLDRNGNDIFTYIPTLMEYKHGINEYVLSKHPYKKFIDVVKEIDSLINNDTKVIYTTSGNRGVIKHYKYCKEFKDILLMKKIFRQIK